jgi:uncharacterized membrane protein
MKTEDSALNVAPWAIAAVLIAGVVHIISVLLMPLVAPRDAYHRLLEAAKVLPTANGVTLLEPMTPGAQLLPFEDPATVVGVCLYDLSNGLLHLRAAVDGDNFLGLSFHSATGPIFHAVTDRGASKGKVDIIVGDARQIEDLAEDDPDDAPPPPEIRVTAPAARGFVLIRALAKRASDAERARESVKAVRCEAFQPPQ